MVLFLQTWCMCMVDYLYQGIWSNKCWKYIFLANFGLCWTEWVKCQLSHSFTDGVCIQLYSLADLVNYSICLLDHLWQVAWSYNNVHWDSMFGYFKLHFLKSEKFQLSPLSIDPFINFLCCLKLYVPRALRQAFLHKHVHDNLQFARWAVKFNILD